MGGRGESRTCRTPGLVRDVGPDEPHPSATRTEGAAVEATIRDHFSRVPAHENPRPRALYDVPDHEETLFAIASDQEATSSQVALVYKQPLGAEGTLEAYRQDI